MNAEKKLIRQLEAERYHIERSILDLQQRVYSIRVILDRLSGPAPSGGKKALSVHAEKKLLLGRKKTIAKKAASVASPTAYQ